MLTGDTRIFGIRHHGPGSARSLVKALDDLQPDIVLVEGPSDADALLPLAGHDEMVPPVALLVYVPDQPRRCAFYPFAVFSPEWQAINWALRHNVAVRFMDLPQSIQLALEPAVPACEEQDEDESEPESTPLPQPLSPPGKGEPDQQDESDSSVDSPPSPERDPLRALAEAAGYGDGERWWDHMVEQRADSTGVFAAILEAMTELRADRGENAPSDPREPAREAFMRQTIRNARKEGRARIAVVCGAWHAPALADMGPAKADKAILDGLPKLKTACSWIPWTNSRLCYESGYGAGIESPGWYHHLWSRPGDVAIPWMVKVAQLLREQGLDASPASVIESVRLAECLASLRGRPLPGLPELGEATQTVLCFGSDIPMRLVSQKLIVGETLGEVPPDTPSIPLLQDLQRMQKRLRLPAEAAHRDYDLDLRKPFDLERSEFLHRLRLLAVLWGTLQSVSGAKGTFHESWRLQWHPEFSVGVIEMGIWGNTVADASSAFASDRADKASDLPALTKLLESVLLARLPDALKSLIGRLDSMAASAGDVTHLMGALPPLANVLRYGDVRGTDTTMIAHTIDGLVARICIGLAPACASLDDDAATAMSGHIAAAHGAIGLLQIPEHASEWNAALTRLIERPNLHGRIGGHCTRLLLDAAVFSTDEAGRLMGLALSTASEPAQAAAWIEGFLMGSGLLLVHDHALWGLLDIWVAGLHDDAFTDLLPLLRRTFSTFSVPERRALGERAREGRSSTVSANEDDDIDHVRAAQVLPYVAKLLGLEYAV